MIRFQALLMTIPKWVALYIVIVAVETGCGHKQLNFIFSIVRAYPRLLGSPDLPSPSTTLWDRVAEGGLPHI